MPRKGVKKTQRTSERHVVYRMSLLRYLRKRDKANEDEGTGSTIIMGYPEQSGYHQTMKRNTSVRFVYQSILIVDLDKHGSNAKENVASGLT
ncbi:hypothetical protein EVAR_808_1 [Eumeta japonica]|uniref:Uncharacterized protein n=1 Tax=Eumeta variegata TaxID=151549 RepID=A0A4C1SEC4_EUMVA|nr:hypothetical protein EVAR_808_1 [Eumeta japonica]